jgi:hypothetical protein
VVVAETATVRLPRLPASRFWMGNVTVAVSPWPAVTVLPARTPMSLTALVRCEATPADGESKQTVPAITLQTTASDGLAAFGPVWRMPTTARHWNGPANGAPFAPAGSENSGAKSVERSLGFAGSNGASVER